MKVYRFKKFELEQIGKKEISNVVSSFPYLVEKLGIQKRKKLSNLKWYDGKNYNWACFQKGKVTLIIRQYGNHFTFFGQLKKINEKHRYDMSEYFMFTYNSNTDLLSDDESDARCDDNFMDIEVSFESIMKLLAEGHVNSVWNSYSCTLPKHVEVKIGFEYSFTICHIHSFDLLIFGCEEISGMHEQFFAENEMWTLIKRIKKGDVIRGQKVEYVCTELSKHYSDPYYHSLGVKFEKDGHMQDVYSLTQFFINDIKEFLLNSLVVTD